MHGYFKKQIDNLRKTIILIWKREILDQIKKCDVTFWALLFGNTQSRTAYKISDKQTWWWKAICSNKCRLCKTNIEDVVNIISGCLNMSSRYYLPLWHDAIAKHLFQAHIMKKTPRYHI